MLNNTNLPSLDVNFIAAGGEIISSVSIEKIVSCRKLALDRVNEALALLEEADKYSQGAGGVSIFSLENYPRGDLFSGKRDEILTRITKRNDRHIWQDLINKSGMLTLMDEQARTEWNNNLESGKYPEVTQDNIIASFEQLNAEKNEVFERGVINVFRSLSWNYKTNQPHMFGRKVILGGVVTYDRWGFSTGYHHRAKLDDLERILALLDGKTVPDHRIGVSYQFQEHVNNFRKEAQDFDSEYFTLRYFKKGSGHLTFKRPDLTEKLNDILSRYYPGALPPVKP
jgi:hypothetical protein